MNDSDAPVTFRMPDDCLWVKNLTDREKKEVEFCMEYADRFAHGTDGHTIRMIVAKMAYMLNDASNKLYKATR